MFGVYLLLGLAEAVGGTAGGAAAPAADCLKHPIFFVLPPWWEYLHGAPDLLGQCAPVFSMPGDILPVGLALLDMLFRLAGFLAIVSIIVAGAEYITAAGNTEKITNARKRIINALTGLAIVLIASAVVTFIGRVVIG